METDDHNFIMTSHVCVVGKCWLCSHKELDLNSARQHDSKLIKFPESSFCHLYNGVILSTLQNWALTAVGTE